MSENNTPDKSQTIKKRRNRHKNGFAVSNEELLYHIADAGLLCKLHGVKAAPTPRTYYFDFDTEVKAIIDKFTAGNTAVQST